MTWLNLARARSELIHANARSQEQRAALIENEAIRRLLGGIGYESSSGVLVNADSAMTVSAVYACVRVLAETVATLPLFIYQRTTDGGKSKESRHPLYGLLHDAPNDWQTSVEWREMMMGHLALRGNAYSYLDFAGNGYPLRLIPLHPDKVRPFWDGPNLDIIRYEITDNAGHFAVYPMERILHLRGLSSDGLMGISPIGVARESIGLAKATEEYGARLFSSYGRPGGILTHPAKLTPEAAKRLRDSWQASHAGLPSAHKVAVLEEGMSWHQVSMNAEDAQFLQTRQYQITEIARLFRIPPHMIGDLSRATFSNVEQQSLEFVTHTIRPWLVRWEQALSRSLLPKADHDRGYFIEFLVDGLLRGDIASRYQAYSIGRNNGWLSANDIRRLENMNPLPDRQGDLYLVPLNMVPAETLTGSSQMNPPVPDQAMQPEPAEAKKENIPDAHPAERSRPEESRNLPGVTIRRKLKENYRRLFEDGASRILKREIAMLKDGIRRTLRHRDAGDLSGFVTSFYADFAQKATATMLPIILTYGKQVTDAALEEIGSGNRPIDRFESFARSYADAFGVRYSALNRAQLLRAIDSFGEEDGDLEEFLLGKLSDREPSKAKSVASRETVQAGGAFARFAWAIAGVSGLTWVTNGDACPICRELDGVRIGIKESFIPKGGSLAFGEDEEPVDFQNGIQHPALHRGCECLLAPN